MGTPTDLRAVRNFLEENRQQTTISLAYFCLDYAGMEETAKFVRDNPFVKHLDLRGNDLKARGVTALSNGMKTNRSLRSLNLKWNSIGKDMNGLSALCEVLKANLTIKLVDFRSNHIDAAGARVISEMLKGNGTITHIDLGWNTFGREGGVALLDGLKKNMTLIECQLSGSKVGEEVLHEVAFFLRRNRAKARKEAEELGTDSVAPAPEASSRPATSASQPGTSEQPKGGYTAEATGEAAAEPDATETGFRPRTVQRDRSIMLQIMMRERDEPLPEGKAGYIEIAEYIDGQLLQADKHKQGEADGKERERQSTEGFQGREDRYNRDIFETEEGIKQSLVDIGTLEVKLANQRYDLVEFKKELEDEKRAVITSKQNGDLEEQQLSKELHDVIEDKHTLADKLALNNKDLELLAEENERLRHHVENFKKFMADALS